MGMAAAARRRPRKRLARLLLGKQLGVRPPIQRMGRGLRWAPWGPGGVRVLMAEMDAAWPG